MLDKSNKLVLFSFDMVPKYIDLRKCATQTSLKPHEIGTLAMGSDRIIAKQRHSLLGLSLKRYVMTQVIYV